MRSDTTSRVSSSTSTAPASRPTDRVETVPRSNPRSGFAATFGKFKAERAGHSTDLGALGDIKANDGLESLRKNRGKFVGGELLERANPEESPNYVARFANSDKAQTDLAVGDEPFAGELRELTVADLLGEADSRRVGGILPHFTTENATDLSSAIQSADLPRIAEQVLQQVALSEDAKSLRIQFSRETFGGAAILLTTDGKSLHLEVSGGTLPDGLTDAIRARLARREMELIVR